VRQKLGECLVQAGLIAENQLQQALREHTRTGEHLGVVLARLNLATEAQIAQTIASQLGLPYVDLTSHSPEPDALRLIPQTVAREHLCLAISVAGNVLTVAMADPLAFSVIEDLESRTGLRLKPVVATRREILELLESGYESMSVVRTRNTAAAVVAPSIALEPTPVEDVFARIIQAFEGTASEVHVEPGEHTVDIRYRVDGVLKPAMTLPGANGEPLVRQIKSLAGLAVEERRLPQTGRIERLRVSTLQTIFGEKIVIQRIATRKAALALDALGLSGRALRQLRALLRQRSGVILFAGPRGSGATTTLAAAVSAVATGTTSVVAIADPIEYEIPGVTHVAVDPAGGAAIAAGLLVSLQQNPDVVAIGELCAETAAAAFDAAEAGCLVLSPRRGEDAAAAAGRSLDFGATETVTAGRVAASLLGIVAQRLVRRLCVHCRQRFTAPAEIFRKLGVTEADVAGEIYKPVGCDACDYTGYRGWTGIFEVMTVTDRLRRLIGSAAAPAQIREQAVRDGMVTLAEDGLSKVHQGMTSVDELLRTAGELVEPRTLCTGCGTVVNADFKACPGCGTRLGACRHCGRALDPGWQFCPYCARGTAVS